MITVQDVARAVDGIAPFDTQLDWDNSGLLVGDPAGEVDRVLVALDATAEVIREAASLGAQAIVTHHPVIFRGVQRLLAGDPPYEAAARGIAIISAHTCYDMAEGGVNHALADALALYGTARLTGLPVQKLRLAAARGERIPLDWAVDQDGQPTDDPQAALNGFLLPIGGYKGLGLAYAVDILSGVITGGLFADQMRSMYHDPDLPSGTGHLMIAMDLKAWIAPGEMKRRMEHYHSFLQSIPMAEGAGPLVFPGEPEARQELRRRKEGIPIPGSTLETLEQLGVRHGVRSRLETI